MKNNLSARALRVIACQLLLASLLVCLLNGCSSSQNSAVDRFFFVPTTNTVPVVTNYTVTVQATNDLGTVETRNIVTWQTNIETQITYTVSTNTAALVRTGTAIGNIFSPGWGEAVGVTVMGLFGLWARLRTKRATAGATVLAQSLETLLQIIETDKGKAFADTIKLRLVKDQNTAGVLREIAALVESTVDNEQAKALARTLLETLPAPTPQT